MITGALILSNLLGFLLQILLPFYLVPSEYAVYSVVLAISQVVLILAFEWLRLPVLRYSNPSNLFLRRRRGALFFYSYGAVFFALVLFGATLTVLHQNYGSNFMFYIGLAMFVAAFQGAFEGAQSYSRAQFFNRIFSISWVLRSLFTLTFCLGLSYIYRDALFAVVGYVLSFAACFFVIYFRRILYIKWLGFAEFSVFLKYGLYLTVATVLASILAPAFKSFFISVAGEDSSGGVFWVFDVFVKVFAILGMAVNLAISQKIIKNVEAGNLSVATLMTAQQLNGVFAMVLPVYVAAIVLQNHIVDLFVPADYAVHVNEYYFVTVTSAAILSIRMFSLDTIFIVFSKIKIAFVSPVITIFVWLGLSYFFDRNGPGAVLAFCLSLIFGLFFSFVLSMRFFDFVRFSKDFLFTSVLVACFAVSIYVVDIFVDEVLIAYSFFVAIFILYFVVFFYRQRDLAFLVFGRAERD